MAEIAIGMNGSVDSSMAAALLQAQGSQSVFLNALMVSVMGLVTEQAF